MKKIILATILLVFTAATSFSQTVIGDKNNLYISGKATLDNGQCNLQFTDNAFSETYVVLTPVGSYLQLYVDKKEKGLITVKCANSKTGTFDYVIIVKKEGKTVSTNKN